MAKSLKFKKNELYLGKHSLKEIAKKYQTPLMIIDGFDVLDKMNMFDDIFASNYFTSQMIYASKAFLTPKICQVMKEAHWFIDATSGGDLFIIEQSGFPMANVVFHGNNKSQKELKEAVLKGVGIIVVDHLEELADIIKYSEKYQKEVKTMVRINPGIEAHTHQYTQTSLTFSKFGVSIEDDELIDEIMNLYSKTKNVKLLGFHSHIGSQVTDAFAFCQNAKMMILFTKKIQAKYQCSLRHLNLGGGFGIFYHNEKFKLDRLLIKLKKAIEESLIENNLTIDYLYLEPGRSIIGEAGFTLYTVDYIKTNYGGKKYVFIDGGMNDNIRPALYQAKYRVDLVDKNHLKPLITADVVGKCCESGDIIALDYLLNEPKKGDLLIVYSTGAYCYSMAMNYNSALKPCVLWIEQDIEVIARREKNKDLMKLF